MRLSLQYDARLSRPNTWRLAGAGAVTARVRVASAKEHTIEVPLRRSLAHPGDVRAFVRDIDGAMWVVAAAKHHPDMPLIGLVLTNAPDDVQARLRAIA